MLLVQIRIGLILVCYAGFSKQFDKQKSILAEFYCLENFVSENKHHVMEFYDKLDKYVIVIY